MLGSDRHPTSDRVLSAPEDIRGRAAHRRAVRYDDSAITRRTPMSADAPAPREPPEISNTGEIGPTGSTIANEPTRSTIAIGPTGATGTTQLEPIVGSAVEG